MDVTGGFVLLLSYWGSFEETEIILTLKWKYIHIIKVKLIMQLITILRMFLSLPSNIKKCAFRPQPELRNCFSA